MMLLFNTSKVHMSITLVNKTNSIDIEFYINDNKELFDKLYSISEKYRMNWVLLWVGRAWTVKKLPEYLLYWMTRF